MIVIYLFPSSSPSPEEEDFDKFLESVKARQLSITTKGTLSHSQVVLGYTYAVQ